MDSDPAPTSLGEPAGYELAFREGVRQLEHQERALDELRSRAGTLLAASALATSFLGAAALQDAKEWTLPIFVAVIAFGVTLLFCLVVLWPLTEWRFVNDPTKVIGDFIEDNVPAPVAEIHRELALRGASMRRTTRLDFGGCIGHLKLLPSACSSKSSHGLVFSGEDRPHDGTTPGTADTTSANHAASPGAPTTGSGLALDQNGQPATIEAADASRRLQMTPKRPDPVAPSTRTETPRRAPTQPPAKKPTSTQKPAKPKASNPKASKPKG